MRMSYILTKPKKLTITNLKIKKVTTPRGPRLWSKPCPSPKVLNGSHFILSTDHLSQSISLWSMDTPKKIRKFHNSLMRWKQKLCQSCSQLTQLAPHLFSFLGPNSFTDTSNFTHMVTHRDSIIIPNIYILH